VSQDGEMRFLVMELLRGADLGHVLRARGYLPAHEVCRIIVQVLSGLQYAHEHGLVHHDLKPSNLMLAGRHFPREHGLVHRDLKPGNLMLAEVEDRYDGGSTVKILDLGVAPVVAPATITSTQQIMGTLAYMSPDQIL